MKQYSKTKPSHPPDARVSGWSNGLSQDYNRGLGAWFASRLGARYQLMTDFAKAEKINVDSTDECGNNPTHSE